VATSGHRTRAVGGRVARDSVVNSARANRAISGHARRPRPRRRLSHRVAPGADSAGVNCATSGHARLPRPRRQRSHRADAAVDSACDKRAAGHDARPDRARDIGNRALVSSRSAAGEVCANT
jgi:hypothetical protein